MDLAAISLAAFGAAVLFAIILQFVLWLKVRFDHKASVLEWKGVIENAVSKVDEAGKTFASLREAQARLEAGHTALGLKQTALEESFAHFNAKTVARAREEAKSARKESRAYEADSEATGADNSDAVARAIAEQQALGIPAQAAAPASNQPPRLRVKRFGS